MNPWRYRLAVGVMIYAVMRSHSYITSGLENTPLGMFIFHGSAALLDLMLIYFLPCLIKYDLCWHIELSCFASIICNAIGWFLYLAYAPPGIYNSLMWSIAYFQWGRLLMADIDDSNFVGIHMVFNNNTGRY